MEKPWFDPATGPWLFDQYVMEMPSFKKIVADALITEAEVMEQWQRVTALFQQLEGMLSPEAKTVATEALCELAVLNVLQLKRLES